MSYIAIKHSHMLLAVISVVVILLAILSVQETTRKTDSQAL